ncbi:MAG: hypothetical protein WA421_15140, partial [Nitrososphaeraceae archaeon]
MSAAFFFIMFLVLFGVNSYNVIASEDDIHQTSTTNNNILNPASRSHIIFASFGPTISMASHYGSPPKSTITDNLGNQNQNWADIAFASSGYKYNKKIAFVEPTFTYAAYQSGSFYDFYKKY